MHVQTTDPTHDRGAFIGCAVACALVLGSLILADKAIWSGHASEAFALTSSSTLQLPRHHVGSVPRLTVPQN